MLFVFCATNAVLWLIQWSFSHYSPAAFSHSSSVVPAAFISHSLVVLPVASHSTSHFLSVNMRGVLHQFLATKQVPDLFPSQLLLKFCTLAASI